jgi:hypothetical protein
MPHLYLTMFDVAVSINPKIIFFLIMTDLKVG